MTKTSGFLALGLACAVLGSVVLSATAPPPQKAAKVNVCHWSDDTGSWTKLSIGAPALAAHLRNHDDAIPGGTTSQTSTELDDDCQTTAPALLTCPCWNTYTQESLAAALNAEIVSAPMCQIFDPGSTAAADELGIVLALAENGTSTDCQLRLTGTNTGLVQLTSEQANTCNAELTSVIPQVQWCTPHK